MTSTLVFGRKNLSFCSKFLELFLVHTVGLMGMPEDHTKKLIKSATLSPTTFIDFCGRFNKLASFILNKNVPFITVML